MILNSIDITNWKCFDHKVMKFDRFTLLNWKNGEGKTSLIQAIVLCLFDKRPDNLDFASLIKDPEKPTKIVLNFTNGATTYIVEREVGKTSAYRLFKDEELISRTASETKALLGNIVSSSILTSLWGCAPLAESNVLNTSYLYDILEEEFKEPLEIKDFFNKDKSYNQKHKSTLESQITNQDVTQEEIDKLKKDLDEIEEKIKSKAFISDAEVVKAKQAKEDFKKYNDLLKQLAPSVPYDRELCVRLKTYGTTEEEWNAYFDKIQKELDTEKSKSVASPLTKYPKNVIAALINESKCNYDTCALCGAKNFKEPEINYDTVDNDKIQKLERILEDRRYKFSDFIISAKYWSLKKQIELVEYSKDIDFDTIINNYSEETNNLYTEYEEKKKSYSNLDKDLAKINELLEATKNYDLAKQCIQITEEYIKQAKEYYAEQIIERAAEIVKSINTRYVELFMENGIYKAKIWDKDFTKLSTLPVQSLSNGEKTCAALALILAIRDLFMPDLPLIMDESFVNLDADNLNAVKEIIHKDKNQWIIVSHDERLI